MSFQIGNNSGQSGSITFGLDIPSNYLSDILNNINIIQQTRINNTNVSSMLYDSSLLSQMTFENKVSLSKYRNGIVTNYYQPYDFIFSSFQRNNYNYSDYDIYEKISFLNLLNYINNKSLLNAFDLNNKIHKNLQEKVLDNNIIEKNLAFNYIDSIYHYDFGSMFNILSNDETIKQLDKFIARDSSNLSLNNWIGDIEDTLNFVNKNNPNKDISFNEIIKFCVNGLAPPYYFDIDIHDDAEDNFIHMDLSKTINNKELNMINFGGIEYEQNFSLINDIINKKNISSNNVIFYYYIQDNFDDLLELFNSDLSDNSQNIYYPDYFNDRNLKTFIQESSLSKYNYGNIMFMIDSSYNDIDNIDDDNNILDYLNLHHVLIPDFKDISNQSNSVNLLDLMDFSTKNYQDLSNTNSIILLPMPKQEDISGDNFFRDSLFNYNKLIDNFYLDNSLSIYSVIVSTNNTDLVNILCQDSSFSTTYSNLDLYMTYYDIPNICKDSQDMSNDLLFTKELSSRQGKTYLYYPFYFDSSSHFLNKVKNFNSDNGLMKDLPSEYNINSIQIPFYKGFVQIILLYLFIHLFSKSYINPTSYTNKNFYDFYKSLLGSNDFYDNSQNQNVFDELSIINSLFNLNNYVEIDEDTDIFNGNPNISSLNNNINITSSDINFNNILLAIASKHIKLDDISSNNKHSYYTLYDLSNIKVNNITSFVNNNIDHNQYIINNTDISFSYLEDEFRYYLLNNWQHYYPNNYNYL